MLSIFRRKEAPPPAQCTPHFESMVQPSIQNEPSIPPVRTPRKAPVEVIKAPPADDDAYSLPVRNRRLTLDLAEAIRKLDIAKSALRKIANGERDPERLAVSTLAQLGEVVATPEPTPRKKPAIIAKPSRKRAKR